MEPSEITGSNGEKVAEADFIISDVTRPDGTTPTYDVLLDDLKDLLAVNNGFTIRLNTDLLFTTETGGDQ